jgi:hypothetical protein
MRRIMPFVLLLAFLAGCSSGGDKPKRTLTEYQRDSLIGASDLPGAGVVRRAMAENARAQTRAAKMDSLYR